MKVDSHPLLRNENQPTGLCSKVVAEDEVAAFDRLLGEHHYLGAGQSVGDYLRQAIYQRGDLVALLVWEPACYALKDRDRWI
jgi:hypothetical protein